MFCPECGTENPEGKSYCRECGAELKAKPGSKLPIKKRAVIAGVALAVVAICGVGVYFFSTGSFAGLLGGSDIVLSELDNEKLRNYLSEKFDEDKDGTISVREAEKVTKLGDVDSIHAVTDEGLSDLDITDFGFLMNFPNVEVIVCKNNPATSLDVSGFSHLKTLVCSEGKLIRLKANGCENLSYINCLFNQLSSVNVSGDSALTDLKCDDNDIETLDIAGASALKSLSCDDNRLTSLDVSGLSNLTYLSCSYNELTSLTLSPSLENLYCNGNQLSSVDFSGCTKLTRAWIDAGLEFGKATGVDDAARKGLSALALEYLFCLDEYPKIAEADRNVFWNCTNPEFALRLAHVALCPGAGGYGLGWYGSDGKFVGEFNGVSAAWGITGNTISDEDLRKVLRSFCGIRTSTDLSSALGSFSSFTYDSATDTWSWTPVTMPISTNIYTNNFRVSGNLVRFDVGYQQQDNNYNDDVNGSYYTVVAIKDDDSIFGYHLVQIEDMTGDAASEFPALAAAQVASATPYDFAGTWAISDWGFTELSISADGTCTVAYRSKAEAPINGTWQRDQNDSETIVCTLERPGGLTCTIHLTGTLDDNVAKASGSTLTDSGGYLDLGETKVKREVT